MTMTEFKVEITATVNADTVKEAVDKALDGEGVTNVSAAPKPKPPKGGQYL